MHTEEKDASASRSSGAHKLSIEDVAYRLSDEELSCINEILGDLSKGIPLSDEIIGQRRAVEALSLATRIDEEGYNVFVIGQSGTGRRTAITALLSQYKPQKDMLEDIAYACNFKNEAEPILLYFPYAKAKSFQKELQKAIKNIRGKVRHLITSGHLFHENRKLKEKAALEEVERIVSFRSMLKEKGFKAIERKEGYPNIVPVLDGKPVSFIKLQTFFISGQIGRERFEEIKHAYNEVLEEFHNVLMRATEAEKKLKKEIKKRNKNIIKPIIKEELEKVFLFVEDYGKFCKNEKQKKHRKRVKAFLGQVEKDLYKRVHSLASPFKKKRSYKEFIERYDINIIYRNTKNKLYVIDEPMSCASDLFGTIEVDGEVARDAKNGHMKIREGAIHKALAGYLVLRMDSVLKEEETWDYLKNILLSKKIKIPGSARSSHPSCLINPEAVEAVPKIIVIGDEETYDMLACEEADFYKLFKVTSHFDSIMLRNRENVLAFLKLVASLQVKHRLLPLEVSAYEKLIHVSSWIADSTCLLSTEFTKIADCLIEASALAKEKGKISVSALEIKEAIEKKEYLASLQEESFLRMLEMKTLILEVKEPTIAKINGLAVEESLTYSFGLPVAVTAVVSCGKGDVIDIEKEVGLSGEIYHKAHLIITSLLRRLFLAHYPLCISASICSEQSYSFIDGDSASVAHFLALISAIGGIPMRQDIAVTGSLNQLGEIQAVGGVSQKIKGFFSACKILGFTGRGGVLIPESNKQNVFLDDELLQAVQDGIFNIWTVKNIDEAIKLMSGMEKSEYTPLIEHKLVEFARTIRDMYRGEV